VSPPARALRGGGEIGDQGSGVGNQAERDLLNTGG